MKQKACLACGTEFVARSEKREKRFCHRSCYWKWLTVERASRVRTCTLCNRTLPPESFGTRSLRTPARKSRCRECERVLYRAAYAVGMYRPGSMGRPTKANPVKAHARSLLQSAVRHGAIQRKPCVVCGNPKSHGHHHDYRKPLDVEWLCRKHHAEKHRRSVETPFTEADAMRTLARIRVMKK